MRRSQNIPFPFRIYPLFHNYMRPPIIYPSFSGYTPPFSTTICDAPRIYPSFPKYTPPFSKLMQPSQNLPLSPRIYPSLSEQPRDEVGTGVIMLSPRISVRSSGHPFAVISEEDLRDPWSISFKYRTHTSLGSEMHNQKCIAPAC